MRSRLQAFKKTTLSLLSKIPIILVALIWISPFYIALVYSFKTKAEIAETLFAFPTRLYLDNYFKVITENQAFLRGVKNSLLSTLFTVGLLSILTPMCSYALARNHRNRWFGLVYLAFIGAILIPWQGIMFPVYVNFKAMGLTNTWWGYVIARTGFQIPICILTITGFVKGIPMELEESAALEGAGMFKTFWMIVYPVMKPVNVTVLMLNIVFAWNDFAVALTMLPKAFGRTLPLAQFYYFGDTNQQINLAFAFFILSMLPIILLYLFVQKHIVKGIATGAIKG
jgi:raffinose/stachyose/melibiose transport system permease protein